MNIKQKMVMMDHLMVMMMEVHKFQHFCFPWQYSCILGRNWKADFSISPGIRFFFPVRNETFS